jgi:uncharacterized protein YecT (DUF1311 family)
MYLRTLLVLFILPAGAAIAEEATVQLSRPQPSFACAKAGTSVELVICADAKLAEWDTRLGQAYKLSLTRLAGDREGRRALIEAQRQWILLRNGQCNQTQLTTAKPCILEMTKARIEVLQKPDSADGQPYTARISPPVPAIAQTSAQAWDWCAGKDGASAELQINACTTVINSRQETQEDLAVAFGNRGNGYQTKGDYYRAIAEYDAAIQLNPNDPIVFSNRGIAYGSEGVIDHAIADFNEAIRLDPNFAEAYAHRGLFRLKRGDTGGKDDIATATSLKPALTDEIMRQQALMTAPPPKQKGMAGLPTTKPSGSAGAAVTSPSSLGPASKQIHSVSHATGVTSGPAALKPAQPPSILQEEAPHQ